jgi:hypothetical protein
MLAAKSPGRALDERWLIVAKNGSKSSLVANPAGFAGNSGIRDGIHGMPSGLYHTADSLANGPYGTFVSKFGPPGDPTVKQGNRHETASDRGDAMGIGRAPRLLTTMQSSRQRSNARS